MQDSCQLSQKTQWHLNIQTITMHHPTHHMLRLNKQSKQLMMNYRLNHVSGAQNAPINPKVIVENNHGRLFQQRQQLNEGVLVEAKKPIKVTT